MDLLDKYLEEISAIKELIKPIVDETIKANRETILLDLITGLLLQRDYKAYVHLKMKDFRSGEGGSLKDLRACTSKRSF